MEQHLQQFAMREMAMPLMETPEQQELIELKEKLEQEKRDHQKTKSQLKDAEIKLLDRASEIEGLRNTILCLVQKQHSSKTSFETKNESKFQKLESELEKVNKKFDDSKVENDKKFDDLKEHISKGQMQEELQKLKENNKKLESENARLQDDLSNSITKTKCLEESVKKVEKAFVELKSRNADFHKEAAEIVADNARSKVHIDELEKTHVKKDKKIQELEEIMKQKDCRLEELEKKSSDVVDKLEKKNLECEELKKKYEETIVKSKVSAMKVLDLKHTQQQLQQQLDEITKTQISKELKECLIYQKLYLDANFHRQFDLSEKLLHKYIKCFNGLSAEDQNKCLEDKYKYEEDLQKKRKNAQ